MPAKSLQRVPRILACNRSSIYRDEGPWIFLVAAKKLCCYYCRIELESPVLFEPTKYFPSHEPDVGLWISLRSIAVYFSISDVILPNRKPSAFLSNHLLYLCVITIKPVLMAPLLAAQCFITCCFNRSFETFPEAFNINVIKV